MRTLIAQRLHVVGTSGSGKSVLAAELARRLEMEHIQVDTLYWGPDWTPTDRRTFEARVEAVALKESWVIDGGHRAALPLVWKRAEVVVWLDYPLATVFARLVRRTIRRLLRQEKLSHGNTERFDRAFGRRSHIAWSVRTQHWWIKREIPRLLAESPHVEMIRLRSPREAAAWLATLAAADGMTLG